MPRNYTQTFGVVGAILEKDGKILLIKEGGHFDETGTWNQPAGWINLGENPLDAAVREVKEETGFDIKLTSLLGIYSVVKESLYTPETGTPHPLKFIFCAEITGGELMQPNEEVAELRWFTPEEINAMEPGTLRDMDIKQEVVDYFAGKQYPLDIIHHSIQ